MAVCTSCQQEMHDRVGCTLMAFNDFQDARPRQRILYGSETLTTGGQAEHCPDCLSPIGAVHHPGCDIEQCPCCDKQAVSCGCAVQFRPSTKALLAALAAYRQETPDQTPDELLVFTDIFALSEYSVTSVFHWPEGADPLGWWLFAEEREVSPDILRVIPMGVLLERDPGLTKMLQLAAGKKAFREEGSDDWIIRDID